MTINLYRGRVITENTEISDGVVVIDGDKIAWVGPAEQADDQVLGGQQLPEPTPGRTIMPGFVDIHCHGGGGASFPNAETAEVARTAANAHLMEGTTSLVASLVTASPEVLRARTATLRELCEAGELAGIHLEGPFVSHERCGAQDPTYIQEGNPELTAELCEIGGGYVKWMTLAPESANNMGENGVAHTLIKNHALPSWGHTDTDALTMRAALAESYQQIAEEADPISDRPLVTHLFNGMRPIHHRTPGPVLECIAAARHGKAVVELIGDAIHLNPATVRAVYQLVGRENMVFVTDAMEAAGMPDGMYELGSQKVVVKDRVARLAEGESIAGGTARILDIIRVAIHNGIPLTDAVYMGSAGPAKVLARTDIGALEAGRRADMVITDDGDELAVSLVMRAGEIVRG